MRATTARPAGQGSRLRLTADQRRAQIFRASTKVLAANGYAGATLTDIAERAGVAKGLLWHYFEDRDDLMRQTLAHLAREVRESVVGGLDLTSEAPSVIRAVLDRTAALTRTHADELDAIDQIVHSLRTPDGRPQITLRYYETTYAEHERLLARGQAEGSIREGDVRVMAVSYQGVIDGMIGYLRAYPEVDPLHQSSAVADVLLNGLARVSDPPGPGARP